MEREDNDLLQKQLDKVYHAEKLLNNGEIIPGMSLFISAAMRGDLSKLQELYLNKEEKIDINHKDEETQSALHWASFYNESSIVEFLLNCEECDVNIRNKRNGTPLHMAVLGGAHSSLKVLLNDSRVDVNSTNCWGETPLILTAQTGDAEAAKLLIQFKAKLDIKDKWNQSVFDVANNHDEFGVLEVLNNLNSKVEHIKEASHVHPLKEQTKPTKILSKMMEAPLNDKEFLTWINDEQIDVLSADFFGLKPIHKCSAWNKTSSLSSLLSHPSISSLINQENFCNNKEDQNRLLFGPSGDSPIHSALEMGAIEAAILLSSHPCLAVPLSTFVNNNDFTALCYSISSQNISLIKNLLESGSNPIHSPKSNPLHSPFSQAKQLKNEEIILLLTKYVDPFDLDNFEATLTELQNSTQKRAPSAQSNNVKKLDRSKFAAITEKLSHNN